MVFDILCFIDDLAAETVLFIEIDVSAEQIIGSYQNLSLICCFQKCAALRSRSYDHSYCKPGSKTFQFTVPVIDQGSRGNDQRIPPQPVI